MAYKRYYAHQVETPDDLRPPFASRQEAELARMGIPLTPGQLQRYREWVQHNPTGGDADFRDPAEKR